MISVSGFASKSHTCKHTNPSSSRCSGASVQRRRRNGPPKRDKHEKQRSAEPPIASMNSAFAPLPPAWIISQAKNITGLRRAQIRSLSRPVESSFGHDQAGRVRILDPVCNANLGNQHIPARDRQRDQATPWTGGLPRAGVVAKMPPNDGLHIACPSIFPPGLINSH